LDDFPIIEHTPISSIQLASSLTNPNTSGRLAAAIGIPILGFLILAAELMIGVNYLVLHKFLAAMIISALVYFFGVIFAGRYVNVIGETTTYKLFTHILNIFHVKMPALRLHSTDEEKHEGTN
jgi:hypothetical protein